MYGILIELILSYVLLKYLAKQDMEAIGVYPCGSRLKDLLIGILWPIMYYCCYEYVLSVLVDNPWKLNIKYDLADFCSSFGSLFRSVIFEELIFRGAILYLLFQRFGIRTGILLSASSFGIYHWFAWQAFGDPVNMLMVFAITASAGLVFAFAFYRSQSLYLPIGLHLGCNLATMVIFSKSNMLGEQLLVKSFAHDPVVPKAIISLLVLLFHFVGFQLLTWVMLKWYLKQRIRYLTN